MTLRAHATTPATPSASGAPTGRRSAIVACASGAASAVAWARGAVAAGADSPRSLLRQQAGSEPPPARPLVYVALGASDGVGVGAADPAADGWVPQLLGHLPAGTHLVNLSVSGTLLRAALAEQAPAAVAAAPDLVTVWLAVNDFNARVPLAEYAADLDALLATLRDQTAAVIATGNLPDLSLVPAYGGTDPALLRAEVARWNAAIADMVTRRGALLVDLAGSWTELAAHPEYVGSDGFHPGNDGYRRLADLFWEVLSPAVAGLTAAANPPGGDTP